MVGTDDKKRVGRLLFSLVGFELGVLLGRGVVGDDVGLSEGARLGQIPTTSKKSKSTLTPARGPVMTIVILKASAISAQPIGWKTIKH